MATDLNRTIVLGRLTQDPEYKNVNGNSLVTINIANNLTYSKDGQKKEEVSYFECVCWGKLADIVRQYCTKGSQVLITGRLRQERWDGDDGKKHSKVRIKVETLQMIGGKKSDSPGTTGTSNSSNSYPATGSTADSFSTFEEMGDGIDDDMPF